MGGSKVTLKKDLALFQREPVDNPYERYFLLRNPFPGRGETDSDVCTDQDAIKGRFVSILQDFSSTAKRLRINGKSGAGKTNILRYFERLTDEARRSRHIGSLHPIYISNPGESYFDIHGQIVDRLSELFLGDLLRILQSVPRKKIAELSAEIKPASELLTAVGELVGHSELFPIYSERREEAFVRWLKGQKLLSADKKLLTTDAGTPPSDITSPSLAMRFLNGLLGVLQELGLCDGIVLLFDEFEEIFEGLPHSRQTRYAQDLRHFFDMLKQSVFFIIASVPEPKDLRQYPAIERRLGEPMALQPIDSLNLATQYVSDYLNSGRDKYEMDLGGDENQTERSRPNGLDPLTEKDVAEEYGSLKQETDAAQLDVLPGYFLPRIRERVKEIVEGGD